jgi:alkaline phosphatase
MESRRDHRRATFRVAAVGAAVLAGVAVTAPVAGAAEDSPARSVIFINGDGMAAAHREAARLHLAGFDGQLEMDRLPVSGSLTTDPRDPKSPITDSAAAATAWATGQKTYNGAISVDVDKNPLPELGAQAKAAGKATGLVTSAQVTDASPAAWFAQTPDRGQQDEIARQYLEVSKPDVILGGGEDWWLPAGTPGAFPDKPAEDPTEGSKGTKGDLIAEAQSLGYTYASTPDQLAAANGDKLLGLFSNEEQFQQKPEGEGDLYNPVVDLPTMTRKALDTLGKADGGFFLFIEEEGVDEFSHENNGEKMLLSMQRLDAAVAVAKEYVVEHPDTLLVVTGDHECGGLTVEDAADAKDESGTPISTEDGPITIAGSPLTIALDWTTTGHTGVPVPVTAQGPGADAFTGQHPNTLVHDVVAKALGI